MAAVAVMAMSGLRLARPGRARAAPGDYVWRMGHIDGGGFANTVAASAGGHVAVAGDVWGTAASDDYGDTWYRTNLGAVGDGGMNPSRPYGRVVTFSKKFAPKRFFGFGPLRNQLTGKGSLSYVDPGIDPLALTVVPTSPSTDAVDFSSYEGGSTGSAHANVPPKRPTGRLIAVDWYTGGGHNIEYLYMATREGIKASQNRGVTMFDLGQPAVGGEAAWSCINILPDEQTLYAASYQNVITGAKSRLFKFTNVRNVFTGGTVTETEIKPLPGGVSKIEDIMTVVVAGANVTLLACGGDGLVKVGGTVVIPGGDPDVEITCIDQGPDGKVWIGNGQGNSSLKCVAWSTDLNTWHWLPGTTATVDYTVQGSSPVRTWWLQGQRVGMDTDGSAHPPGYNVSQIAVAPDDGDTVYVAGRSGVWVTRDGGATWRPCMNGYCGSESGGANHEGVAGFVVGPAAGEWWVSDIDYHWAHTTDDWETVTQDSTGPGVTPPAASLTRTDGSGNVYVVNPTVPPTVTVNGVDKTTPLFQASCVNPKDMAVDSATGRVTIALSGGVLVGDLQ